MSIDNLGIRQTVSSPNYKSTKLQQYFLEVAGINIVDGAGKFSLASLQTAIAIIMQHSEKRTQFLADLHKFLPSFSMPTSSVSSNAAHEMLAGRSSVSLRFFKIIACLILLNIVGSNAGSVSASEAQVRAMLEDDPTTEAIDNISLWADSDVEQIGAGGPDPEALPPINFDSLPISPELSSFAAEVYKSNIPAIIHVEGILPNGTAVLININTTAGNPNEYNVIVVTGDESETFNLSQTPNLPQVVSRYLESMQISQFSSQIEVKADLDTGVDLLGIDDSKIARTIEQATAEVQGNYDRIFISTRLRLVPFFTTTRPEIGQTLVFKSGDQSLGSILIGSSIPGRAADELDTYVAFAEFRGNYPVLSVVEELTDESIIPTFTVTLSGNGDSDNGHTILSAPEIDTPIEPIPEIQVVSQTDGTVTGLDSIIASPSINNSMEIFNGLLEEANQPGGVLYLEGYSADDTLFRVSVFTNNEGTKAVEYRYGDTEYPWGGLTFEVEGLSTLINGFAAGTTQITAIRTNRLVTVNTDEIRFVVQDLTGESEENGSEYSQIILESIERQIGDLQDEITHIGVENTYSSQRGGLSQHRYTMITYFNAAGEVIGAITYEWQEVGIPGEPTHGWQLSFSELGAFSGSLRRDDGSTQIYRQQTGGEPNVFINVEQE